jgi:uncharacterized protein (TIRG00374 family)
LSNQTSNSTLSTGAQPTKRRVSIKTILKFSVSIALITFIYSSVNISELLLTFKSVSLSFYILISALYALGQLISAVKWNIFLKCASISSNPREVVRAYFVGMFVNTFGFGTIGGDVARALALNPKKGLRAASLATVVADRIHGLSTLLIIGSIAVLIVKPQALGDWAAYLSFLTVVMVLLAWVIGPRVLTKFFHAEHKFGAIAAFIQSAFVTKPKPIIVATLISFIFHLLQILIIYLICVALEANLSLSYLLATVPFVNAASALPISSNGIGVREYLYLLFFVPMGVDRETIVAISAIWLACSVAVSAIGGAIASRSALITKLEGYFSDSKIRAADSLPE